jgi:hypothetical protein
MFITNIYRKLLVIPIIFSSIYLSFLTNKDFLGTPYYGVPSEEFIARHSGVLEIDNIKHIILWAFTDKERLYIFPYSKETKEKIDNVVKDRDNGIPIIAKFRETKKGSKYTFPTLDTYMYDYKKEFNKDYEEKN